MITTESSDLELMSEYDNLNRHGCGESVGDADQTPAEAAEAEGWTVVRAIHGGTNCPGTPVLASDLRGRLWVVNDLNGPWAQLVSEEE